MASTTVRQRQYRAAIEAQPEVWQRNPSLYIGQDSFYGAPGQSWPLNDMMGEQVVRMRWQAQREKQYLHSQSDIEDWTFERLQDDDSLRLNLNAPPDWTQWGSQVPTQRYLAGREKQYLHAQSDIEDWTYDRLIDAESRALNNLAPPDWTAFGSQIIEMRRRAGAEKNYLHANQDVQPSEIITYLLGQDTIYDSPGQQRPLNDMFSEQVARMRRRAGAEKQYVHAASDNRWGYPVPLLGQDRIYRGPGQVPTVDWTQFGLPPRYYRKLDQTRSVALRSHTSSGFYVIAHLQSLFRSGARPNVFIDNKPIDAIDNKPLFLGGKAKVERIDL